METRDIVTIVISICTAVIALIVCASQIRRGAGKDIEKRITDAREKAASDARIESKLMDISSDTREIKSELASVRANMSKMSERLGRVEQRTEYAHDRINKMEGRKNV